MFGVGAPAAHVAVLMCLHTTLFLLHVLLVELVGMLLLLRGFRGCGRGWTMDDSSFSNVEVGLRKHDISIFIVHIFMVSFIINDTYISLALARVLGIRICATLSKPVLLLFLSCTSCLRCLLLLFVVLRIFGGARGSIGRI
jgi:hypothetical protein